MPQFYRVSFFIFELISYENSAKSRILIMEHYLMAPLLIFDFCFYAYFRLGKG